MPSREEITPELRAIARRAARRALGAEGPGGAAPGHVAGARASTLA